MSDAVVVYCFFIQDCSTLPSSTLDHVQLFASALDSLYQFMSKFHCCDISLDELVDTAIEQLLSCVEGRKVSLYSWVPGLVLGVLAVSH